MNTKLLLLPLIALASCSKPPEPPAPTIPTTPMAVAPTPTPDPAASQRARVLARVEALPEADCDALVLRFQLVPRDEVLQPLSNWKRELIRYVKRIASAEQLTDLEKVLNERKKWPMQ